MKGWCLFMSFEEIQGKTFQRNIMEEDSKVHDMLYSIDFNKIDVIEYQTIINFISGFGGYVNKILKEQRDK